MTPIDFEPVIGLEVHVQLATRSKMFSSDPAGYGAAPNTCVNEVSLGLPGALPTINRRAVELAVMAGLALDCTVNPWSQFARKHYFYADLPKGYQISQYEYPICEHGRLSYEANGEHYVCSIRRLHLEEDTGKSLHTADPTRSLMDYNRAGTPLIEIVSEPEIRSASEAAAYLRTLHEVLVFLGVTLGNLEEGHFRCDANVSVRPRGSEALGTRTEIKNVNSFKFVEAAIQFEIARQIEVLTAGSHVLQETRLWDNDTQQTHPMRLKSQAEDYRYFPDPDLPPLTLTDAFINTLSARLPELPQAKRARYAARLGLSPHDIAALTATKTLSDFFEAALSVYPQNPKTLSNLILKDVLRAANAHNCPLAQLPIPPSSVAEIARLLDSNDLTPSLSSQLIDLALLDPRPIPDLIDAHGLRAISDEQTIINTIQAVLSAHPDETNRFRAGEKKLLGVLMGFVMRALNGKGDPGTVRALLQKML